jgi:hypothetical protein
MARVAELRFHLEPKLMRRIIACALLLAAASLPAHAVLQSASVTPGRTSAGIAQDSVLAITWRLTTDAAHFDGAQSTGGEFFDAAAGVRLDANTTTLGALTGGGILVYPETLTIPAAQLAQWHARGVRLLGYRRTFASRTPPTQSAQVLIRLNGTGLEAARQARTGELVLQRLDLEFESGRRIEIVERGARLVARLTLLYAGSGTLRGRWEVADPAGSDEPLFRVLQVVRAPLGGNQQHTLDSSPLPTDISGRYVLRFCVEPTAPAGSDCASSDTTVQTVYAVTSDETVPMLRGLAPDNLPVDASTAFEWTAVAGVTTYQLQIFRAADPEPLFVGGMLLDESVTRTALSAATRARLEPGRRYLWRVTAHGSDGRLLARSAPASFLYQPSAAQDTTGQDAP